VVPPGLTVDPDSISDGGTYDEATHTITWNLSAQPVGLLHLTFNTTVSETGEYDNIANVVYRDDTDENTNTTYHHSDLYILHIRQVLLPFDGQTSLPPNLGLPVMGYMQLKSYLEPDLDTVINTFNITSVSENDIVPQHFTEYILNSYGQNGYSVTDIIPQYFEYVGYVLTPDIDIPHDVGAMNTGTDIMLDYSGKQSEYWLTVYLRSNTNNPNDNETTQATNPFGIIESEKTS
jgi:hypothetical protein